MENFHDAWQHRHKSDSHHEEELDEGPFKDYDSVQLEGRRTKMFTWGRQLQHERNLSIEENKMLAKQVVCSLDRSRCYKTRSSGPRNRRTRWCASRTSTRTRSAN